MAEGIEGAVVVAGGELRDHGICTSFTGVAVVRSAT